jgi:hypothetical protein
VICVDIIPADGRVTEPSSKPKFRRQLDRPRGADLIQRIEAAKLYVTPVAQKKGASLRTPPMLC